MWQVRAESMGGAVLTFGMEADGGGLAWERALGLAVIAFQTPLAVRSMTVSLIDPPGRREPPEWATWAVPGEAPQPRTR